VGEVAARGAALTDREARRAAARAAEPRYVKLIRALCDRAGQKLDHITAGTPEDHLGERTMAWHFLTDRGHFYMVEADGKAFMHDGKSREVVATIDATETP
jgi:hypothetical protein